MKLTKLCPVSSCKKVQKEQSKSIAGRYFIIKLECGHTFSIKKEEYKDDRIIALDGSEPYPFQYEGIKKATESGLRFLFADEMGLGKANPISSLILTPKGYVKMGDIKVSDRVIGEDGQSHNVIGVYPQGSKEVFELTFSDGSKARSCDEHLWSVNTSLRKWRGIKDKVLPLFEIRKDLKTTSKNSTGKDNNKWQIPITKAVEFDSQPLPIDPYVLGLLIGDGCLSVDYHVTYSSMDFELVRALDEGTKKFGCNITQTSNCDYRINANQHLVKVLDNLGLKGIKSIDKFVPDIYKINSASNRLRMLQGLMDTDGSIWSNGVVEFTTISPRLADDVRFLVQSLGGIVKTSVKEEPKYQYKGETLIGQRCYRLVINIPCNPFKLLRKREQWQPRDKYKPARFIVSVESVGTEECQCIMVDNPSHLYLMEEFVITHNTVQILGTLKANEEKVFPCIILVKAGLKHQWARECIRWLGKEHLPFIVHKSGQAIPPIFDTYIIGLDLLRNLNLEEIISEIKPKTIIIDECQLIKNIDSKRTQMVQALISGKVKKERKFASNLNNRKKIEMIAMDLMKWHGVSDRFTLNFEDIGKDKLGLCESKVIGEGTIGGRITIHKMHAEHDPEDGVIDTILHEIAHAITPGAGHKDIWWKTAQSIGCKDTQYAWCQGTVEYVDVFEEPKYVLAASGTPIKNNAIEYFPILNILDPGKFPSFSYYLSRYIGGVKDDKGKVKLSSIRPAMMASFQENTKHIVIRRERTEVMPDLPLINRSFFHCELGDQVGEAYKRMMAKFQMAFDEMESEGGWGNNDLRNNVLSYITRMRHLAGIAKIDPCVDWISEFLQESDRKLCIFVHHQDVAHMLCDKLQKVCEENGINSPLNYTSSLDAEQRDQIKSKFANDPLNRVFILSTLAAGEGLDGLQKVCSDMILLERQWNPANEEQVEGRFSRIGSAFNQVNSTYFLATGTIDEFFAGLVEEKRKIVKNTLNGTDLDWHEGSLMRELVEILGNQKFVLNSARKAN